MLILKDPQRSKDQVVLPFLHFGRFVRCPCLEERRGQPLGGWIQALVRLSRHFDFGAFDISISINAQKLHSLSLSPFPSYLAATPVSVALVQRVTTPPWIFLEAQTSRPGRAPATREERPQEQSSCEATGPAPVGSWSVLVKGRNEFCTP